MNIKEFIYAIQSRPQMYVEEVRLDYIYYLISGYVCSVLINKGGCNIDREFKEKFLDWTVKWVRENLDENYEKKHFWWYCVVYDVTSNEKEAIDLFFKLCDRFFQEFERKE